MKSRRKIIKKFLLLLRNIRGEDLHIKEIEFLINDGTAEGLKLEIRATKVPRLHLMKGNRDKD